MCRIGFHSDGCRAKIHSFWDWGNFVGNFYLGSAEPGGADMRDGPGDEKSSAGG